MANAERLSFGRIAIVGASGAAGRALVPELLARGFKVRVISRRRAVLEAAFPDAEVEKTAADALDAAALREAVAGCDLVVNAIGTPAQTIASHIPAARNVAAAMRAEGARGLHVSSFWAYLPIQRLPLDETHARSGGNSYIEARRGAEDAMQEAGAAVVHLPDFFGPHVEVSVLQQALSDAAAGKAMNWIGGAEIEREHIFLPDAGRLIAELATHPEAYGERWMFPGAGPLTGRRAAEIAGAHLGRRVKLRAAGPMMLRLVSLAVPGLRAFMPMVPHYARPIRYDAGKLARLLGPPELTPYDSAIAQTLDWLNAQRTPAPA